MKRWIKVALSSVVALGLVIALGTRFGLTPPMGVFLNPFSGAWKRVPGAFESGKGELHAAGLEKPVRVVVDQDQIKHLFASSDHDLYFAQGYVLASERLWQMEFMVRVASGRVSEVLGEKSLEIDTYFTRIGLPGAAERSAPLMLEDPVTGPALKAYAEGVNAYIAQLTPATVPFEYKLLGHKPITWEPRSAAYLLKFMAWNLSASSSDLPLSRSAHILGAAGFDELFPLDSKVPEPIIPAGTAQVTKSVAPNPPKERFEPTVDSLEPLPTPHPSNGSNNWAVTGKKSTTGLPILSNDIHLGLSLPALWYEMQLVSPTQNVYGISLPGAPGIILGFNKSIAWGVTNGGDDIMDWFQLRFRDEKRNEYLFNGAWRPVVSHEILIKVRGEADKPLLIRETQFGPIVYDKGEKPLSTSIPVGLALKWGALTESNELKNFILMNRARDVAEFRRALDGYQTPAQNFLVIDNKGQSAMWQFGKFPLRWKGQGRLISDGSDPAYDWQGYLTPEEVPTIKNPARGFYSSANQAPFDETSHYYFGWPFEQPWRATRINEILRSKPKFAPEDFIKMQRDTVAVSMRELIPVLLSSLPRTDLSESEKSTLSLFEKWDYSFEADSRAAPLAYSWYKQTEIALWSRLFPDNKGYRYPYLTKTIEVLKDENSKWFDDPSTDAKETRGLLVLTAYRKAIEDTIKRTGVKDPTSWTWAAYRPTDFGHAGKLPGLGHDDFAASGMEHAIFANTGSHGPVWKMVAAVGPKPKVYGVYPGGQSGDPFSPHFEDFVELWRDGKMKQIEFMESETDSNSRKLGEMILSPGTGT